MHWWSEEETEGEKLFDACSTPNATLHLVCEFAGPVGYIVV